MVAQMAKAVRINDTVAVSRGPRRSAAQTSGRIARNPSGLVYSDKGSSGLNGAPGRTRMARPSTAAVSACSRTLHARAPTRIVRAHRTITGVTTERAGDIAAATSVTQIGTTLSSAELPT